MKDIETAFQAARKGRAEAALVLVSTVFNSYRTEVIDLSVKSQLPAIFYSAEYAELGGLMAYATSYVDLYRRVATYVDKILKGSQASRSPSRATDKVRADYQSENSEADRLNDSAKRAGESG